MKTAYFQRVQVHNISLSILEESGYELSDGGITAAALEEYDQETYYLNFLTNRQKQVVKLLTEGYTRKEIADKLDIILQAVHQIIPRIRRRLRAKISI
jgi:DNA-binding NarL/FixJ family response regulator